MQSVPWTAKISTASGCRLQKLARDHRRAQRREETRLEAASQRFSRRRISKEKKNGLLNTWTPLGRTRGLQELVEVEAVEVAAGVDIARSLAEDLGAPAGEKTRSGPLAVAGREAAAETRGGEDGDCFSEL